MPFNKIDTLVSFIISQIRQSPLLFVIAFNGPAVPDLSFRARDCYIIIMSPIDIAPKFMESSFKRMELWQVPQVPFAY